MRKMIGYFNSYIFFSFILIIKGKIRCDRWDIKRNWIIERTITLAKLVLTEIAEIVGLRGIIGKEEVVSKGCWQVLDQRITAFIEKINLVK